MGWKYLFVGNSNVCFIYRHFREICNRYVYDLDLDLLNVSMQNIYMSFKKPLATFYLLALNLNLECAMVICKYANGMEIFICWQ